MMLSICHDLVSLGPPKQRSKNYCLAGANYCGILSLPTRRGNSQAPEGCVSDRQLQPAGQDKTITCSGGPIRDPPSLIGLS